MNTELLERLKDHHFEQYTHVRRVSNLCVLIGFELGLNQERLKELKEIGLYHDIGKIKIPIHILSKPDKLTEEEFEIIKLHTIYSLSLLDTDDKRIREAILYHHENLDGSGYFGVKGVELNLYQKILHVADVFEALTSKRCYREAWTKEAAYEYMAANSDTMFDRNVVKALCKIIY